MTLEWGKRYKLVNGEFVPAETITSGVSQPETQPVQTEQSVTGQPQSTPWYKPVLNVATWPFKQLHEKVEVPGAAMAWSGVTPPTTGTQGMGWLPREIEEYKAWQAPKFVKGATEFGVTAPLMLIPGGQIKGVAQAIGRGAMRLAGKEVAIIAAKEIEPTVGAARPLVEKLINVIKGAGKARRETEVMTSAEKAIRAEKAAEMLAKGRGREAFEESKKFLAGEYPKATYEAPLSKGSGIITAPKVTPPTIIEIRNWRDMGLSLKDIKELKTMSPELRELTTHQARLTGFRNVSSEVTDDYLQKALKLAEKRNDTKAIESLKSAIEYNDAGILQNAILDSEKGLGYLHQDELAMLREVKKVTEEVLAIHKPSILSEIPKFTEDEVRQLYDVIIDTPKLSQYFDRLNTYKALDNVLYGGIIPQPAQLALLEKVYGKELVKVLLKKRSVGEKVFQTALDVAGIPRAILSSWDLSGTLRQGGILFARDPIEGTRLSVNSVRALLSDKNAAIMYENMGKRLGNFKGFESVDALKQVLGITELPGKISTPLARMEETFATRFVNWIPGIKASNRAYVTVLNELRSRRWEKMAAEFEKLGAVEKDFQELAKFISVSSGRGTLPRMFRSASPILNATLFSPKLLWSRFQTPMMLFSSSPLVRKEAIKTFLAFGGFGVGTLSGLALMGAKVELDPRSSDFGKAKIGNTRLDFWTGYSQLARFTAQFITGQRKATTTGRIQDLPRGDVIQLFLQSKSSPAVGLINDILRGTTYVGEEMKMDVETVQSQLYQRLAPLFIQDLIDGIQADGIMGGLKALPSGLGVGVTTYIAGRTPATKALYELRDKVARQTYGMSWDEVGTQKGKLYQTQLEQSSPELKTETQKVQQEKVEVGGLSGKQWADYQSQRTSARNDYDKKLQDAQNAYDNGQMTGYKFKNYIQDAGAVLGGVYGHIDKQYPDVIDYLSQPMTEEERTRLAPEDIAFQEYMGLMFGKDMEDELGQYKWGEAEYNKQLFIAQWGQETYDYVQQRLQTSRDVPPLMKEYYKAQQILQPYWRVRDEMIQSLGQPQNQNQLNRLNSAVSRIRKRMRQQDSEGIGYYYNLFYSRSEYSF